MRSTRSAAGCPSPTRPWKSKAFADALQHPDYAAPERVTHSIRHAIVKLSRQSAGV